MNVVFCIAPKVLRVFVVLAVFCLGLIPVLAANPINPAITVATPQSGSLNVATNATVTFAFNHAVLFAGANFYWETPTNFISLDVNTTLNGPGTLLTCTPATTWPTNTLIYWEVYGEDAGGNNMDGNTVGTFTTVGDSHHYGYGRNSTTYFYVGKQTAYRQTSAATPVLRSNPYDFFAAAFLISNRVATVATITLPNTTVSNLTMSIGSPEQYVFSARYPSAAARDATWPYAAYTLTVASNASTLAGTVTPSASQPQPAAPRISNFTNAQSIDSTAPFTLTWDAFTGGGVNDFIGVTIFTAEGQKIYETPVLNQPGALNGTTTSVVIPTNTFSAINTSYVGFLTHFHVTQTPGVGYTAVAYRGANTQFELHSRPLLYFTNFAVLNGVRHFDVVSQAGQSYTLQTTSNLTASSSWQTWITTNSASGLLHIIDGRVNTNRTFFYRARIP
jgi:hypothetical protein